MCADYNGDDYEETLCLLICDRYITRTTNSPSHDFNAHEIRLIIGTIIIIMYIGTLFSYATRCIVGIVGIVCAVYRVYGCAWDPKAIEEILERQTFCRPNANV